MSASCCHAKTDQSPVRDLRYRRVLWAALGINAAMFLVEIVAGLAAGSLSLQADALDFLGDAANYGISLFVLGMALSWRASAALLKGASMGLFGLWVLGNAVYQAFVPTVPEAEIMGVVGFAALVANIAVAAMLFAFRDGDSNRRSVWLCSRNDAIGNLAVLLAATGVFATGTGWPDLMVAGIMAGLALSASVQVVRQSLREIRPRAGAVPAE
ncbi:cation diffusion facilitator family transporter [Rhodospirillaceae bacterium SYSU D60014]|uniref:cation transporter n=1 Tax=Virgifigura deserti TaxID=2268457 RepID=UPI000E672352